VPKGKGFPLGKRWNKTLWEKWDNQSPEERQTYEQRYEDRDNSIVELKMKVDDALQI
jgi:hypothetical protein